MDSFQIRYGLSNEDYRNFQLDVQAIDAEQLSEEEEMDRQEDRQFDDIENDPLYLEEMDDEQSIISAEKYQIELFYDSISDMECPF